MIEGQRIKSNEKVSSILLNEQSLPEIRPLPD